MHYRLLGKTGLKVSEIGLGCNRIGEKSKSRSDWLKLLNEAADSGAGDRVHRRAGHQKDREQDQHRERDELKTHADQGRHGEAAVAFAADKLVDLPAHVLLTKIKFRSKLRIPTFSYRTLNEQDRSRLLLHCAHLR